MTNATEAALRLLDLAPRYLSNGDGRPDWSDRHWHEIAFLCPKCRKHEIAVAFWSNEPRDRVQVDENENENGPVIKRLWQRQGQQGFHDLTLTPSINREGCGDKCGGWHGFITNGEAA